MVGTGGGAASPLRRACFTHHGCDKGRQLPLPDIRLGSLMLLGSARTWADPSRIPGMPPCADFGIRLGYMKEIGGAERVLGDLLLQVGVPLSDGTDLDPLSQERMYMWPVMPDFSCCQCRLLIRPKAASKSDRELQVLVSAFRFRPRSLGFKANCFRVVLLFLDFPRTTRGSGPFCVCHGVRGMPQIWPLPPRFDSILLSALKE